MANSADLDQKPTDLDLHCLQRQCIYGFSRTWANHSRYYLSISLTIALRGLDKPGRIAATFDKGGNLCYFLITFLLKYTHLQKGGKISLKEMSPLKVYPFRLRQCDTSFLICWVYICHFLILIIYKH